MKAGYIINADVSHAKHCLQPARHHGSLHLQAELSREGKKRNRSTVIAMLKTAIKREQKREGSKEGYWIEIAYADLEHQAEQVRCGHKVRAKLKPTGLAYFKAPTGVLMSTEHFKVVLEKGGAS